MWTSWLLLCFVTATLAFERDSKVVKTASGPVRGFKNTKSGVFEFLNIPYASAPTGVNKFKAPLPPPTWLETRDSVKEDVICPQAMIPQFPFNNTMEEDCLLTSVYVPDTKEKNLPVVVYVHGGGFVMGFGNMLKPYLLVKEHNIIIVTFNYRLGVHGFLCLGTEDVPGNVGMKDQVTLLRWVQKNIASFGGNPDDITIMGSSAGSASVDLLMLSKSTKGLFNKVIPESGASTAAFSVQPDPLENAKWFAKTLGFDNVDDIYALEEFYKTVSIDKLTSNPFLDRTDSTFVFSPCVERPLPNQEVFLNESPVQILKHGKFNKVPLLYGFANMEGLIRVDFFDFWKDKMNEKLSDFLPADLKFKSKQEKDEVAMIVKEFYFGDDPVSNYNILEYVNFFSDVMFTYPMLRAVKLQVEDGHKEIYLYEYTFTDDQHPVVPHTEVRGADHCAQTIAVFGEYANVFLTKSDSEEFKAMSLTVRQLWANFIKTSKPVPDGSPFPSWPAVSKPWTPHMEIDRKLQLKGHLLEKRAKFWESIYDKYYREPSPPPVHPTRRTEL